jgi:hypothetical protein
MTELVEMENIIKSILSDFKTGNYLGALSIYHEQLIPHMEQNDTSESVFTPLMIDMRKAYDSEDWETMISLTNQVNDLMESKNG